MHNIAVAVATAADFTAVAVVHSTAAVVFIAEDLAGVASVEEMASTVVAAFAEEVVSTTMGDFVAVAPSVTAVVFEEMRAFVEVQLTAVVHLPDLAWVIVAGLA